MPARQRKIQQHAQTSLKEFVTVAFAEDVDLAKQYKKLLNDNNIPSAIRTQPEDSGKFPGVAVMVPEDYLDEAHVLIESEGSYNDFYDMVFHDQDADDINEDEDFDADF